jgi:membrane fusion protein, multidrug efflux system
VGRSTSGILPGHEHMNLQVTPQPALNKTATNRPAQRTSLTGAARFLIGLVLVAALMTGFYFYTHLGDATGGRRGAQAAPVKVAVAEERDMPVVERTIGTVVANSTVSVTARVQGLLLTANFREGQLVKKGDLLFQIDPGPYQAAYDSALAALAGAKTNADRSANLLKQNAIAPQINDNAQSTYLQAKANAEAARLNLEFTTIRSPIDGKTGPMLIQPGNVILVAGITATVAPLVTITQIQPVKISFSLSQADLPRIQARARSGALRARVLLHDMGGEDLVAPVDFISNTVNPTSGTIELRATFANADSALVPGQLVDVVVELANIPHAVVVPREAVNIGPNGDFVYTANDKIAIEEPVKVLFDDSTNMAIQGHVKAGDNVITDGQLRVQPGAKVSVTRVQDGKAGGHRGKKNGAKPG